VGTEDGYAPFSNWYTLSSKDLQTGVATAVQSDPFGDAYAPVEVDVPLLKNKGHKWFWAPNTDEMILSTDQLMDLYYKSVGRGSVLLLNSTPDTTGLIPESHAAAYKAFGDEIRRRFETPLKRTEGEGKMLEITLPKAIEVNHVMLQEDLSKGQRVLAFNIQALDDRGEWKEVYHATSVGFKRICYFDPVRTRRMRVVFTNAKAEPKIANFALFNIKGVVPAAERRDDRDRFYDGVGEKQGQVAGQESPVQIGAWTAGAESGGWKEISLDITKHVSRIGQYEIAFTAAGGGNAELEFQDWEVDMYGGAINDAIEQIKGRPVFRLTRSQQTLNDFPARFRVKVKSPEGARSGSITIRRITY
jgi:alpha-L-fucosidase